MERFEAADEDTEDLWNSPSKKRVKSPDHHGRECSDSPERTRSRSDDTLFDREEAREAALRHELQTVQGINQVIEGVLESLTCAKGNMATVSCTVNSASTLLNTWTRILSQTEHNQRLILNPKWQGATQDIMDMEAEAALKQQAAEKRELELRQRREAAAKKAEEERKKSEAAAAANRGSRGTTRGRVRGGLGRAPSISTGKTQTASKGTTRGSTSTSRIASSGIARGAHGTVRGRGRT